MGQPNTKHAGAGRSAQPPQARSILRGPGTNTALVNELPKRTESVAAAEESRAPVILRYRVAPPKQQQGVPPQPKPPVPKSIDVLIEAEGWKRYPLTPSADDFFTIVSLPKGVQGYKFIVDGQEVVDPQQEHRPPASPGGAANVVTVAEGMLKTREELEAAEDETEGWSQEPVAFEETRKLPPILPPHLRYTPLNTPPTQYRADTTGVVSAVPTEQVLDPEHLPLPLSATINHVYFQRREDHVVVGVTTRFRNKYTSVVLYKGETSGSAPQAVAV